MSSISSPVENPKHTPDTIDMASTAWGKARLKEIEDLKQEVAEAKRDAANAWASAAYWEEMYDDLLSGSGGDGDNG